MRYLFASTLVLSSAGLASGGVAYVMDFSMDDFNNPLVNGQEITTPPEFGNIMSLSSTGGIGMAIFDTNNPGPNDSGADDDLLVNLGNALIIQNDAFPTQTVPGIFDTPNDEEDGGTITIDFMVPVEPRSIDLIDINGNGPAEVLLTDIDGNTRFYDAPMHWTFDISASGPDGYGTLDFTTLAPQPGEGGGVATGFDTGPYDPFNVVQIEVTFIGSAALDNLTFVPTPGAAGLFGLAGLAAMRRRR